MLSTTELLVEHIIAGILTLLWVILLILTFLDLNNYMLDLAFSNWGLTALILTAIAYPIGIISDALADKILSKTRKKIKSTIYGDKKLSTIKLLKEHRDENTTSYFKYLRFKERVSRLTVLNFPLIGISLLLFFSVTNITFSRANLVLGIVLFILFSILALGAYFVWRDVVKKSYQLAIDLSS